MDIHVSISNISFDNKLPNPLIRTFALKLSIYVYFPHRVTTQDVPMPTQLKNRNVFQDDLQYKYLFTSLGFSLNDAVFQSDYCHARFSKTFSGPNSSNLELNRDLCNANFRK